MKEFFITLLVEGRPGTERAEQVRILFIGDIIGKPGRRAVQTLVPGVRREHRIDMVIANGETAAGGFGITQDTAEDRISG